MAALAFSCANARIAFLFFHQACFTILKGLCAWRRIAPPGLTLSLPSSNYYTSPLSLSASNLPLLFPAISCVFYIILHSEDKF